MSGATSVALESYERALEAFQGWRDGAEAELIVATQEAPGFVMAHVLRAYLLVCTRDPRRIGSAYPVVARAAALDAGECERLHIAALIAMLADDYDGAKARLGEVLRRQPRDAVALQVALSLDYMTGDAAAMYRRVTAVLPAWSPTLPGFHAVLASHAFALEECGEYGPAEEAARAALDLRASDARAQHVMAHVFEMTDRAGPGVRWMAENVASWGVDTVVARHCWWHKALFHLSLDDPASALSVYDENVRAGHSTEVADLIDASSLLWRMQLEGVEAGARWSELAAAWTAHIEDGFCSFSDLHAMLAFVGAHAWDEARRLEMELAARQSLPTRYGRVTRTIGLPACRALMAFGRNDDALAMTLLASLPEFAHRLGGSQAQRDVLYLTLLRAIDRVRRGARRSPAAAAAPRHMASKLVRPAWTKDPVHHDGALPGRVEAVASTRADPGKM